MKHSEKIKAFWRAWKTAKENADNAEIMEEARLEWLDREDMPIFREFMARRIPDLFGAFK
jgi:hypothetical protein